MHMADALVSPAVGGIMMAASAAAIGVSVKKMSKERLDEAKLPESRNAKYSALYPLMGVMGAFVFAGQMINFTIPGTGSSGHIGGGILLAALLGPWTALITLAAVLLIQCLVFADGGLLAYGANVFNMGVASCLLAYPFIYKPIIKRGTSKKNITIASIASVVVGLQIGAFAVVLQTMASGVTALPFGAFAALMQPIHLAIGLVEGIVTASVLSFVHSARPEILDANRSERIPRGKPLKKVFATLVILTVLVGGGLSLFASSYPDGLEWSIAGVAGETELESEGGVYDSTANIVESTAFMPDYSVANTDESLGTSTAGIIGSAITFALTLIIGVAISLLKKKTNAKPV
ncbi:MAG: energy-coupling factor ABC transporter permease [Oscillospiraceae bacterium]|jgi:cobalt/nickel transport system permease protein|nr:energy-coupling factor ABC transporter permease [Oscillospiraceae bacterium]